VEAGKVVDIYRGWLKKVLVFVDQYLRERDFVAAL
jgi:hypothetical protein